jgi:hypothetical protein
VTENAQVVSGSPFTEPSGRRFFVNASYIATHLFCHAFNGSVSGSEVQEDLAEAAADLKEVSLISSSYVSRRKVLHQARLFT